MAKNFTQFTEQTTAGSGNFVVGYDANVSGGEKKYKLSTVANTVSALMVPSLSGDAWLVSKGSNTPRSLANRFADVVNVLDFGADPTGVVDSQPAIQAAINSCGTYDLIYFPKGIYKLDSNAGNASKPISFIINPNVTFTGVGQLIKPTAGYGFYYDGEIKDSEISLIKSDDKTAATGIFVKYSNKGDTGLYQNPALCGLGYKFSTATGSRVQGIFGEAIDSVGGAGSFVEGGRLHGICANSTAFGNGVYGLVAVAQSGTSSITPNSSYVIGIESEVISFDSSGNAPVPRSFNVNNFDASFLATLREGNVADAAFLVNPFNNVKYQTGFMVASGNNGGTVSSVAFGCYQTNVVYGLDLAKGSYTYAAIAIPNNSAIRAYNAAGTNENNILTLNGTNILSLGVDTDIAHTQTKSILPAANNTYQLGSSVPMVWSNIYSQNPLTVVSDIRQKKDIEDSVLGLEFIEKLRPVSYRFIEGGNNVVEWDNMGNPVKLEPIAGERKHFGLIAQEVKNILPSDIDFGGWVLSDKNNLDSQQGLRYEEFIAPLIKAIQELSDKVKVLENK